MSDGLFPAAAVLPFRPTDKAGKCGLPDIPLYNQFYSGLNLNQDKAASRRQYK